MRRMGCSSNQTTGVIYDLDGKAGTLEYGCNLSVASAVAEVQCTCRGPGNVDIATLIPRGKNKAK